MRRHRTLTPVPPPLFLLLVSPLVLLLTTPPPSPLAAAAAQPCSLHGQLRSDGQACNCDIGRYGINCEHSLDESEGVSDAEIYVLAFAWIILLPLTAYAAALLGIRVTTKGQCGPCYIKPRTRAAATAAAAAPATANSTKQKKEQNQATGTRTGTTVAAPLSPADNDEGKRGGASHTAATAAPASQSDLHHVVVMNQGLHEKTNSTPPEKSHKVSLWV